MFENTKIFAYNTKRKHVVLSLTEDGLVKWFSSNNMDEFSNLIPKSEGDEIKVSNYEITKSFNTITYDGEVFFKFDEKYFDELYTNDVLFMELLCEHIDKIRRTSLIATLKKSYTDHDYLWNAFLLGLIGSTTLTAIKIYLTV